ncbi:MULTISPECIES: hypothetical protein [unclassified Bradyrhizobium]|uniref:hypothetical protein n=1 Tax=unclassified Bradyrhizobium TaxID=2631580 RepID=UPI0020B3A2DE|nr:MULTISPECIES: hypothetical protein [unclassified Bradyrhizobium]MCP3386449.1 hypothetical protein [Bradyrhizobium sp. CCGUVB4N]MCP3447663.1 hypothetical protein [Bradyrhizobium sp. CCGUVB14]WFU80219.1 hypothetical protein QA645_37925 [Bradyrhizobium sp. CIAT3101]
MAMVSPHRHGARQYTIVIPGRDEVASYDAQLRIGESIEPQVQAEEWIPGSALRAAPE